MVGKSIVAHNTEESKHTTKCCEWAIHQPELYTDQH